MRIRPLTDEEVTEMKMIISPAKKMRMAEDPAPEGRPVFLNRAEELLGILKGMRYAELKALWACSDKIAEENFRRLQEIDLERNPSAALSSYDGIQYQYMAPQVFPDSYYSYVEEHLRILSGFYGILKPLDGVVPYRLEMQARLKTDRGKDLYEYWGDSLYRELTKDDRVILNLASKEYSHAIRKYLRDGDRFISCIFAERDGGRLVEKGVYVKMARGEMVRFLAGRGAKEPEEAKEFAGLGFAYQESLSTQNGYVFLRQAKK